MLSTPNGNTSLSTTGDINNVQSGGTLDMYFVLVDKYKSVIRTDNTSKLFLR